MTSRDKITQLIAGAVIIVALLVSGGLSTALSAEAGRAQLVYADQATEDDSRFVALGIAMGAFRGLFVNYLWLRANALKEEGKFYEAIELSSAITRLQPRFPRVWAFHAWNMAYNISVATKTADERWDWVRAGVNLLRSQAIPKNPNDVLLHKELAWMFIHKIQGYADDANRHYKRKLAEEWTILLGPPPILPETKEDAVAAIVDWFRPVVDAPNSLDALIQQELGSAEDLPEGAAAASSRVAELIDALGAAGLALDFELLRLVAYHESFRTSWFADKTEVQLAETVRNQRLTELLDDPTLADAWSRLLPFVRRQLLIDDYNMSPRTMLDHINLYGPLDYRHPATHALYWATIGVEEGLQRGGVTSDDTINTDRIVMHALQELWRTGTVYYDLVTDEYITLQDFHFADTYGALLAEFQARGGTAERKWRVFRLYSSGYENFLKDVIRAYYRVGNRAKANEYWRTYSTWEGRNTNDPFKIEEEKNMSLDEFVRAQLEEDERFTIPYVATSEVASALTDAYVRGLLGGDDRLFLTQYNYAKQVHAAYFKRQNLTNTVDTREDRMGAMPPDFRDAAAIVLRDLIISGSLDPGQAGRIYRVTPPAVQQIIYDSVASSMGRRGMTQEQFNELFPEPPGMAEYRTLRAELRERSRKGRVGRIEIEQQ